MIPSGGTDSHKWIVVIQKEQEAGGRKLCHNAVLCMDFTVLTCQKKEDA